MKLVNIVLLIVGCTIVQIQARAETLEVEYSSFYSHVKKLDAPETDALRFAFGFKHIAKQRLCYISQAKIVTQKQTLLLDVENNNRFTVPTDKILKMAKAIVVIELEDQANQCDMSVQLETLPTYLKYDYSNEDLTLLLQQYQAFFEDMGGILSFLMPSVEGLSFHFDAKANLPKNVESLVNSKGKIILTKDWLLQKETLKLPSKPLRITAVIEK